MNADLYEQFISLKNSGRKVETKVAFDSFIATFKTLDQKRAWVFSFLEAGNYGHKVRHEIYENLVYPVLLDGYLGRDASSVAWLARTASNLYALKSPHPSLKDKTELALFKEAYSLEPREEIRANLLKTLINWFSFSQHEWPAGILYGMDGANVEQCEEILQEIDFARSLDRQNKYDGYWSEFEAKVNEYIERLRAYA
ncbi:MAG: hypothetical protein KME35_18190 [Aphanocapsa sp. GSE-SYN-MK-11-07L]|jgi:hypothetical protein|nr:hypothetical protein [Aphanocapsa sp. GSE-SYN-MK-11-07L]